MIDIKDISGQVRFSTPINNGAKGKFALMKEDYIILPFSVPSPIPFKLGDYVDLAGALDDSLGGKLAKIYEIVDLQKPTYNTLTGGYDYELRLDAYYWKWKNKIFKYTPEQAGSEASWSLTAALDVQLGVFLRNMKSLGYTYRGTDFTFSIDDTVENKAVAMTYDNMNLLDALFSMAGEDKWNCDCWITDNVIHFGRNEFGDAVKIERGVEASAITRSESQGTYATRIYAFGSTKNIPTNYRPTDEQAVINGVVQKRLMLPADTPYIDAYEGMSQEEAIEDVVVFDDVYPRRVGTLSDVHTRTEEVENEDGTTETVTYYRYKDTGLEFKEEYIIEGQELQITFQSGKLNGMVFGVIFNPSPKDETRGEQLWEIVRNEDYGRPLPDDTMYPADGDQYILSGFDIQLVSDQYIPEAEQELKEKAQKYADKVKKDDGTYPTTLRSSWVKEDLVSRTFEFGQRINLVDDTYFENGRISRVLGWEMNLDIPWDSPVYTIGESMPYSRIGEIEDKVDSLTYKGQTYTGGGGSSVYVIKVNDSTAPSDSNVFSALRSLMMFLRKDKSDYTNFLVKFLGGLISDNIESQDFASGPFGTGFIIKRDPKTGKSYIEADEIYIRLKAYFDSLQIKHLTHVGGRFVGSPASMKCTQVEKLSGGTEALYDSDGEQLFDSDGEELHVPSGTGEEVYRCYFNNTDGERTIYNEFDIDDMAQCREFNVKTGVSEQVSNQYYWRKVIGLGDDYIDLSITDCDSGSTEPKAGDEIVTIGNKTKPERQHVFYLSAYDDDAPCFKLYSGINDYSMLNKELTVLSPNADKNLFTGKVVIKSGSTGFKNFDDAPDLDAIEQDIAGAKEDAANALAAASNADKAVGDLGTYVDGAFKDGVISESEAAAIEKYINIVNNSKQSTESAYNVLYTNPYLSGEAKTSLLNAKINLFGAIENLINSINTAIADSKTTIEEKADVDAKFALYNDAMSDFETAVENANKAIQEQLKSYSDEAQRQAAEANAAANNAIGAANAAEDAVSDLNVYVDGAFKDGIITETEAQAIEKYINTVNETKATLEATYNKLYANPYLEGTAKTNLLNAKITLFGAIETLINSINTAIADSKTTVEEKNDVDAKYTAFISAYASFNSAVEDANKAIQDKIKELSVSEAVDAIEGQISEVTDAAKNDIAVKMGYKSYADMVSAAEKGETVINGGKINTTLIEAKAIVTTSLIASAIRTAQLDVNGKFIVEKDGTFHGTDGTLENMVLTGAYRSPFKHGTFSWKGSDLTVPGLQDNNNLIIPNPTSEKILSCTLPTSMEYDGFTATILNEDFNGVKTCGTLHFAGYLLGHGFVTVYEDGDRYDALEIAPHEGVDIQGFSDGSAFRGWIVKRRFKIMNYTPNYYTISLYASPENGGTVSGGGERASGSTGTIVATPNQGYVFTRWSDNNTNASREVVWDSNKSYTAYFETSTVYYTVTLQVSPAGSGTVSGGGTYSAGTKRTVSAEANSGYAFSRWDDGNTEINRVVTWDKDKTITALFVDYIPSTDEIFTYGNSGTSDYAEIVYMEGTDARGAWLVKSYILNGSFTTVMVKFNEGLLSGKIFAGKSYTITFNYKGTESGGSLILVGIGKADEEQPWNLAFFDGLGVEFSSEDMTNEYKTKTVSFTATRTSTSNDALYIAAGGTITPIYISNFSIKENS